MPAAALLKRGNHAKACDAPTFYDYMGDTDTVCDAYHRGDTTIEILAQWASDDEEGLLKVLIIWKVLHYCKLHCAKLDMTDSQ